MFDGRKLFEYISSFSKIITVAWLGIWLETIIFSQLATFFCFGDVQAIEYINDNVVQIGCIICAFYFCTKSIENVAMGVERFFLEKENSDLASEEESEETEIEEPSEKTETNTEYSEVGD